MEWTEETISRLRSLWQEGLSTAEIGRRMSITKNAVVGKAHRLTLPPRPSPIRKGLAGEQADPQRAPRREPERPAVSGPSGVSGQVARLIPRPPAAVAADAGREMSSGRVEQAVGASITPLHAARIAVPQEPVVASEPPVRVMSPPHDPDKENGRERRQAAASAAPVASQPVVQRRRGQSCCWPLGEPGTKEFRFCGGEPIPGKPYCSEHAQLAYVKLRDRRDTVA